MKHDFLVVGAGFFGAVIAERIASESNKKVLVIDRRPHIGGNCYSEVDEETGIENHRYGTHIFHTSSRRVWDYITRFTEFNTYHHQVLTMHRDTVYRMPINLETINRFYNLNLTPAEARVFLQTEIEKSKIDDPQNFEEKAISMIGRPLYEAFIRSYTAKHWGKDPKDLPADIFSRLPVRYSYDSSYFQNSRWQGIPLDGYTAIFERLLDHANIQVELDCDFFANRQALEAERVIYAGPIDRYFDYKEGRLEWRSVFFEQLIENVSDFQGTSVMNYADAEIAYTRIHEPRHLHPERSYDSDTTLIVHATSGVDPDDPYYPIRNSENIELLDKYRAMARNEPNVIFGGRLGDFAYYDMDRTILAALECYETEIAAHSARS